jgi:hypothetical protein
MFPIDEYKEAEVLELSSDKGTVKIRTLDGAEYVIPAKHIFSHLLSAWRKERRAKGNSYLVVEAPWTHAEVIDPEFKVGERYDISVIGIRSRR